MKRDRESNVVGVIGGGLGGLSAACVLAGRGHRVIVLEQNAWLGGKSMRLDLDGFQFDRGPTILTLPSVLRRVFAEAGRDLDDRLDLIPLDPQWRSFFADGSTLDLSPRRDAMQARIEQFAGIQAASGYAQFLDRSAALDRISNDYFFWRSIDSLKDMFDAGSSFQMSFLKDVLAMRPGQTVHGLVRSYVKDARLAQMLDHFTQYIGSAPALSPAVLCGIAHMQTEEGIWYPRGGMAAISKALVDLATDLGVEFRTNTRVARILHDSAQVRGVELADGEQMEFAAIVANSDSVRTHQNMLSGKPARQFLKRRSYEPACSGVVLYLGLDRRYTQLQHHNFVFSRDPEQEFTDIYERGEPADDPTCYVCAPALTDPDVAPPGGEALYVLVHTPYLRPHHDWRQLLPEYRRKIVAKLAETVGLHDLEQRIVCERAWTPQDIQDHFGVLHGAIYGLASHGRFMGAFKPGNRSRDLRGLYLCGGSTHPGPGVPMVVMSGWIAADTLDGDCGAERQAVGKLALR